MAKRRNGGREHRSPDRRSAVPPSRRPSRFPLRPRSLRHNEWLLAVGDRLLGDHDLAHVVPAREVEHHVGHQRLEDRAEAAGAGAALERLLGDGAERLGIEGEADTLEVEELLVLLGERVLGLEENPDERVFVERLERDDDRKTPDELGNQPEAKQVVGLDFGVGVLLVELGPVAAARAGEADLLPAGAGLDDLLEPVERAAADEQDVLRVDLDVFLLRVLAAALRRHRRDGPLEDLEERLLHAFARHVARDARVLALPRDLVDLVDVDDAALALGDVELARLEETHENVLDILADIAGFGERRRVGDGEGHVEDAGERLREERLADAGGAEEEDVRLVELDLGVATAGGVDALVVVVDGDGEGPLGRLLPDHVLVQHVLDLGGRGDLSDAVGNLPLLILRQDLVAEGDALVADVHRRSGNELPDRVFRLSAKRAAQMLIVRHWAASSREPVATT